MSAVAVASSNVLSFSQGGSRGPEEQTFGGAWSPKTVLYGDRFMTLDRKETYYNCTQHDMKMYDFDGRIVSPRAQQPFMSSEAAKHYVPLSQRRPSAPYRLPKIIVDAYTNLLFGENRFPEIQVEGDAQTEDFIQTLVKVGKLPMQMIRARAYGGGMGTVGLSWCYHNGRPRFEVHNPKFLYVHSWEDRLQLIPRHVTEVYQFFKSKWDGKKFANVYYWYRRDWTPNWDYVFEDVPVEPNKDPFWRVDEEKSVNHGNGVCHLVWIQNRPSDQIDGLADYDGLYESFDTLDVLCSVASKGAILNLDPTLKLKMDPDLVSRMGVKKGSENALVTGKDGDASYMELAGTSIDIGLKLIESKRRAILEAAQCIVPDPHEVAAQGVSSVAIKAMFAPMLSQADVLREQYAEGMTRAIEPMVDVARTALRTSVDVVDDLGNPQLDEMGQPMQAELTLDIPPKIEDLPPTDPMTGQPMVDPVTLEEYPPVPTKVPRVPGDGGEFNYRWPPYFPPTPDDQTKVATMLQTATGGKSFISRQTAIEVQAQALGIDAAEEVKRINDQAHADRAAAREQMAGMTPPGMGGEVEDKDELPPGAKSNQADEGKPEGANGAPPPPADEGLAPVM